MKIRHLLIKNFRGVAFLDWAIPEQSLITLVGPGDSTKTTILDAIDLALSPRWNIPFHDTDFYLADHSKSIVIETTIGELPDIMLTDTKFGFHMRGWDGNQILDNPEEGTEVVLTIRLQVDQSLEPEWTIIKKGMDDKRISSRDREKLGMTRLGTYVDRHLTWSRGSALTYLVDAKDDIPRILAEINREARNAIDSAKFVSLNTTASEIEKRASSFGVQSGHGGYKVALDAGGSGVGASLLALHDGSIPLRQAGSGTKRLIAFATQSTAVVGGAIVLVDEIELALEPYRLRQLLKQIQGSTVIAKETNTEKKSLGTTLHIQTFITTHSPVAIEELSYKDIFVVRSENGTTTIKPMVNSCKDLTNKVPEALLSRKIIVCEGDTEYGLCEELDYYWQYQPDGVSFAYHGTAYVSGSGSDALNTAKKLNHLGYSVAIFGDSDRWSEAELDSLKEIGINIFLWEEHCCTEQRICFDLPYDGLQDIVNLVQEAGINLNSIIDSVFNKVEGEHNRFDDLNVTTWMLNCGEDNVRVALGTAADKKRWFKNRFSARNLALLITKYYNELEGASVRRTLEGLRDWAYE